MGKIIKVSGPLVVADGMADASMADVVRVGPQHLIGEILNMTGDRASIQVYEETSGLGPGAEVVTTGAPLSVELGPGLIENIYDGIQRPLEEIVRRVGANITRGIQVPPLDREKLWAFTPTAAAGDAVTGGDVLGTVPETASVLHKIMVPVGVSGTVEWVAEAGQYSITDNWRVAPSILALCKTGCSVDISADVQYLFNIAPDWHIYPLAGISANDIGDWSCGINLGGGADFSITRNWDVSAGFKWMIQTAKDYIPGFVKRKNPIVINIGATYRF